LNVPRKSIDEIDLKILRIVQMDCRTPLAKMAKELGVPPSTVHYRLSKLERDGIIEGYHAKICGSKLGRDYLTITLVRGKYGPKYHERIGKMLSEIPGVSGVYVVFGETDFVVFARSYDRDDFMNKLEKLFDMPEIERSNTLIVSRIMKEDPRLEL